MRIITFLFLLMSALSLNALELPFAAEGIAARQSVSEVDPKQVNNLITTLQNDAARQKLIGQLQLMVETQNQNSGPGAIESIAEALNIEATGSGLTGEVMRVLKGYGLTRSLVGDLATFVLMMLLIGIGVFINARLAKLFDRRLKPLRRHLHLSVRRFRVLFRLQRWAGYMFGITLLIYTAVQLFAGYWNDNKEQPPLGGMFSTGFLIVMVLLVVFLIWEGVNALLELVEYKNRRLNPARLQTITPIIRNVLLFSLTMMAMMVLLSELGVNIVPLLAGAGVLGIAVGFGAQTLVKDFIAGAMVIFEDLLQIGDVVQLGDKIGSVEKITIRKIQLRDLEGTVHTVPFGEISVVSNYTKKFSYSLFNISIAYRENVDDVIACLQELDQDIRADNHYGRLILEPLEVLGLDQFADSAVIIKARIKTLPHEKWAVGREFNRLMKIAFDERNIEIPFPHQTIYFGEDKQGKAANANVRLVGESPVANEAI